MYTPLLQDHMKLLQREKECFERKADESMELRRELTKLTKYVLMCIILYIWCISTHENSRVSNIQRLKIPDTWPATCNSTVYSLIMFRAF